jgi:transcriptional regulator of heat shock response
MRRLQAKRKMREERALEAAEAADEARKAEDRIRRERFAKLRQELMRRKVEEPEPIVQTPIEELVVDARKFKSEDWEKVKKRDDAVIERKSAVRQAQESARMERVEKQRKLAERNAKKFKNAKRDPERLMKPTAAVRARLDAEDDDPKGPVNSVFMIPRRATPAWML